MALFAVPDPLPASTDLGELDQLLTDAESRLGHLAVQAEAAHQAYLDTRREETELDRFLDLAPAAARTLEDLTSAMFGEILDEIEANLTHALREILAQELTVVCDREIQRDRLTLSFHVERDGNEEDILRGQGGSVCNVVSVGLRLIALSRLDPHIHRPFLVLDEQDCWLKPELVPRFMALIATICRKLGLQVLVISHHPLDLFAFHAQRIFELTPSREHGAQVALLRDMVPPTGEGGATQTAGGVDKAERKENEWGRG